MGVVEIEDMAHLAVDESGFQHAELFAALRDHRHLLQAAERADTGKKMTDRRMTAAGNRAAEPIHDAAPRFVHDGVRQILEAKIGGECAEFTADAEL
ncbi:hypothetical protein IZ6_03780 [Terrihabitans soli]|uniref:Uncharacterized protein n=1 Tax=Terrihabitans soli TaxID=708113 RepID=A0A6S6QEW0_9HYPH|nr:hypothetical protein IZ6_03780 [Terrihabitans soli]